MPKVMSWPSDVAAGTDAGWACGPRGRRGACAARPRRRAARRRSCGRGRLGRRLGQRQLHGLGTDRPRRALVQRLQQRHRALGGRPWRPRRETIHCAARCATSSAASMARRWSSSAPHRWARRVLSSGMKAWRRIKARSRKNTRRRDCRRAAAGTPSCTMPVDMARYGFFDRWPRPALAALLWLALATPAVQAQAQPLAVARSAGGRRHRPGPLSDRIDAARGQPARRLGAHAGRLPARRCGTGCASIPPTRSGLIGLYLERACANVEVQLNGQQLHAAGRTIDPISLDCQRPLLLPLPAALLQAGRQHRRPAPVGLRAAARWHRTSAPARWRRR